MRSVRTGIISVNLKKKIPINGGNSEMMSTRQMQDTLNGFVESHRETIRGVGLLTGASLLGMISQVQAVSVAPIFTPVDIGSAAPGIQNASVLVLDITVGTGNMMVQNAIGEFVLGAAAVTLGFHLLLRLVRAVMNAR